MRDWTDGYVTDIGYTHGYYRELSPALLGFACLAAGIAAPDPNDHLTYCELGCGQGFSANLLAAANPRIQFHATDFNPAHIVGARALAKAAGTRNIRFHDKSFAAFAAEPGLPDFDIIALHGVYSWISAENRGHIVDVIRRRLKVGGLVYISYNTLPGWAPTMPLRRLLADRAAAAIGPISGRIDDAMEYVDRLAAIAPGYFRANPAVAESIGRLKEQTPNYLAHEYFNRDLTPFYHADVAIDLAEAKLTFVCSANLADTLVGAHLTPEQQTFLAGIACAPERETLRDFIVNQRFRRDIFVKGSVPLSPARSRDLWDATRFVLTTRRQDISLRIQGAQGEATLKPEVYTPILDALAEGPRTAGALFAEPAIAALGRPALAQSLAALVGVGHLQPTLDPAGDAARSARAGAFNKAVKDMARSTRHLAFLASPMTGGGVGADRIAQLFLLAADEGDDDPPAFAWAELDRFGHKVGRDGKALRTPEENLAELRELFAAFKNRQMPVLRATGIA